MTDHGYIDFMVLMSSLRSTPIYSSIINQYYIHTRFSANDTKKSLISNLEFGAIILKILWYALCIKMKKLEEHDFDQIGL